MTKEEAAELAARAHTLAGSWEFCGELIQAPPSVIGSAACIIIGRYLAANGQPASVALATIEAAMEIYRRELVRSADG